tara:strand:- start:5292 stop:6863 length:1572 start_codon:yes stop_codon:yes gene_type:complete
MTLNIIDISQLNNNTDDIICNAANTYLGNRGYCIYKNSIDEKTKIFIRTKLIAKPRILNSPVESNSFPLYLESNNKLYLPRYFGIKYFGKPKAYKISLGKDIDLKFNGELRDYQNEIIQTYLDFIDYNNPKSLLEGKGGALIDVGCGRGKTVMALKIITMIKKKTRIIVHKEFLKNQWIERINQFIPDAKIGCIQGPIIDIDDKDIVIIMLQSLSQKEYPVELFDDFGFTIIDECHHISSEVFSKSLQKKITPYSLALSATMDRKDGLTWVFKQFLGEIIYKEKRRCEDNVLIKAIEYRVNNDDDYNEVELDFRGNPKYSTMISKLCNYNSRSEFIISVINTELKININQQIILLSHNKSLLNYIYKAITHRSICSVGYYVGGMKEKDLKESENKTLILATYAMAAEALDIKSLTTLILATPKTDIVQASGRILREKHEQPLIIDIVDTHDPFLKQFEKRKKFYYDNKYNIISTNNELYSTLDHYKNLVYNDENKIWKQLLKATRGSKKQPRKCNIDIQISID